MRIGAYLCFNGNAEDALKYYASVFNAGIKIELRYDRRKKVKEKENRGRVLYGTLNIGDSMILVSDVPFGDPFYPGNTMMLRIEFNSASQLQKAFETLAGEGRILMPLQPMFFSHQCAMVRDKFGVEWLLSVFN